MTRFCIFVPLAGDDRGADLVCYRAGPMGPTCSDSEWIVPGTSEDDPMYRQGEKVIEQSEWPIGTLRQTVQRPDGTDFTRTLTTRDLYPNAKCNECEWEGPRDQLMSGSSPLDELCPRCTSEDTEWVEAK